MLVCAPASPKPPCFPFTIASLLSSWVSGNDCSVSGVIFQWSEYQLLSEALAIKQSIFCFTGFNFPVVLESVRLTGSPMDLQGHMLSPLHQIDSSSQGSPEKQSRCIFIIEIGSCSSEG